MIRKLIQVICVLSLIFCISCSSASIETVEPNNVQKTDKTEPNRIDSILDKLNKRTQELQTYQCQIEYRYIQPSVFDAQTLRKGVLYFQKKDNISRLRVNFQTLQQDEDKEQKYNEQYIIVNGKSLPGTEGNTTLRSSTSLRSTRYQGLWLIQLNYELKNCKYIQLTGPGEPNKPVDVFELVSKNLPIIGFTKSERLKEEFEISLPQKNTEHRTQNTELILNQSGSGLIQVQLKVKPNSVYKDEYVQIDCLIDDKLNLPVGIKAISTDPEGETLENKDVYEIKFINSHINEKIDEKVFDFQIPKEFDKPEVYTLEN